MADISLTPNSVLRGASLKTDHAQLRERSDLALVSIAIPLGQGDSLTKAIKLGLALDCPDARMSSGDDAMRLIKNAADQFMAIFPSTDPNASQHIAQKISNAGYCTLQTDAWAVLELSSAQAEPILERLCPVDMSQDAFPVGSFARTVVEHIGAVVIRTGPETYLLMSASSSARSFWHAIETTIAYVNEAF